MNEHTKFPLYCDACVEATFAQIQPGEHRLLIGWCGHGGGALLRVTVVDGQARHYVLDGPVPKTEAERVIANFERVELQARGARPN